MSINDTLEKLKKDRDEVRELGLDTSFLDTAIENIERFSQPQNSQPQNFRERVQELCPGATYEVREENGTREESFEYKSGNMTITGYVKIKSNK